MWNTKGGRMDQEEEEHNGTRCGKNIRRQTDKESNDEQAGRNKKRWYDDLEETNLEV